MSNCTSSEDCNGGSILEKGDEERENECVKKEGREGEEEGSRKEKGRKEVGGRKEQGSREEGAGK